MKQLALLFTFLLGFTFTSFAQDFIYFRDGSKMEVNIIETNALITIYEMPKHGDKTFQMTTDQIAMLKYADGRSVILLKDEEVKEFTQKLVEQETQNRKTEGNVTAINKASTDESRNVAPPKDKKSMINPRKNAISVNAMTAPFPRKYIYAEYERLVASGLSVGARIAFYAYDYTYRSSSFKEWDNHEGFGVGINARYYFHGQQNLKGFYIGSAVDVVFLNWYWSETYYRYNGERDFEYESGSSVAIAGTGQIGYKWTLGKSFFVEPSVIGGFFGSLSSDSDVESGPILMPGLALGFRL